MDDVRTISKTLSYWLRHNPAAAGIDVDPEGWADTNALLQALLKRGLASDMATLKRIVAENDKKRFEFSSDMRALRARQGHSIDVDLDWPIVVPPKHLFHGTVERFLPSIRAEGLKPGRRHHVHLSPDLATARGVGARRGDPIILKVAAAHMHCAGHVFRLAANGVWLTDRVPPSYLERLD